MTSRSSFVLALLSGSIASLAADETVKFTMLSSGASREIGGYMPQRVKLSTNKPDSITKVPDGLVAPLYAVLPITGPTGTVYNVIIDEPEGKAARLFADSNGNGDLTDDAPAEWQGPPGMNEQGKPLTMYSGGAVFKLGAADGAFDGRIAMYRFDKNDPQRAALKDALLFYRDYATKGTISLGGKTYNALLTDENTAGDFRGKAATPEQQGQDRGSGVRLLIDVNGNGKFESRGEGFDSREPFNIGGTTWEIRELSQNGTSFKVVKSDKQVAEIAPPPDHSVGKVITAFEGKGLEGTTVKFPADYKGKVVLLDFWATWCRPCMMEMPNVVEAYNKYHSSGFEILGVSLDNENAADKIRSVAKEQNMTWAHVYDGGGWKAAVAQLYVINSIPRAFLIDGDTGEVLATSENLRGEKLDPAIEQALAKKKK